MKYLDMVTTMKSNLARIREIDDMPELTDELQAEQDKLIQENEILKTKISTEKKRVEDEGFLAEAEANIPVEKKIAPKAQVEIKEPVMASDQIPATVKRWGELKGFKGQDADLKAFRFGQFFRAIAGVKSAANYCTSNGISLYNVHQEGSNTTGGYLVPTEFNNSIIELVKDYGVFRRYADVIPMSSDAMTQPRRTGGLTAYFVGESTAGTESTASWDQIQYVAKKLMVLTRMSSELSEDAIISIADKVMVEIARAFAEKEDACGFNGDGTSTYGGIHGVLAALKAAAGTPTATSAGGITVGTGNAYSELTLTDFVNAMSKLPTYARLSAKWFASPLFFYGTMVNLLTAAGGNALGDLVNGVTTPKFLGYPVVLSEAMPSTAENSQVCALFGDLSQAAGFADRREMTIKVSDSATINGENVFERDELAIMGTERFDINVHDVGDTTKAGPIVGLQTLNT